MSLKLSQTEQSEIEEATKQLKEALSAKKCWSCGCFQNSLTAFKKVVPPLQRTSEIDAIIRASHEHLTPVKYDCLGCDVCYPALAYNSIESLCNGCGVELEVCPATQVEERKGWPPLPGAYTVLRYQAPVAICTLTDETLTTTILHSVISDVAIVGTLQTENLGVERLISNIIANPNIRFLILCGADSKQAVGHLPGQSLLALAHFGIGSDTRITGAQGKRPILRNISPEAIKHFRNTVNIIDLVGNTQVSQIIDTVKDCSKRNPGKARAFTVAGLINPVTGYLPQSVIPDAAGYFVIYIDRKRQALVLEHYQNDGLLNTVIEGKVAAELYTPAIEKGLVSRLDHAAYLGRELTRAEQALASGNSFVQDAAPENKNSSKRTYSCSCEPSTKRLL